jgi:hypothetical protein
MAKLTQLKPEPGSLTELATRIKTGHAADCTMRRAPVRVKSDTMSDLSAVSLCFPALVA